MKASLLLIVVACGLLLSLWLLQDAMIFGLRPADPVTGRTRGCYTSIELLLDLKTPLGWVRPVQLGVGVVMFLGSLITIANIFPPRSRQ